jgi:hypothetical protein
MEQSMSDDRHDAIRTRAYQLWEEEGRPHGRDEHHWHEASRGAGDEAGGDLTEELPAAPPPAPKPRAARPKEPPQTTAAEPSAKKARSLKPKSAK